MLFYNLILFACCARLFCQSLNSHSTNHAGVIMCCSHCSSSINMCMFSVMISEVYINYFHGFWRDADENLQTWICKNKGCWEFWVCTHFHYGLTNVMFLPPLSPKCLFKESRWMTNTLSAKMDCHSNVCVWKKKKKNPLKLMSMLAKMTTLLLLHFPLCVWR